MQVKELARQMTLVEQSMFRAIKPWELVGLAWTKKDKKLSPHVSTMVQHFNQVLCYSSFIFLRKQISKWITSVVAGVDDLQARIRTLERAIELLDVLFDLFLSDSTSA